jgi:hypothetical protein
VPVVSVLIPGSETFAVFATSGSAVLPTGRGDRSTDVDA